MGKPYEIVLELKAEELGKSLAAVGEAVEAEVKQAVKDVAYAAYANVIAKAQEDLATSREAYLNGVEMSRIGEDSYLINLTGRWPQAIEDGFGPFDMKPGMLNSQKIVGQGKRSGEPWVRTAEDGHKYAAVPMEKKPFATSGSGKGNDLASAIQQLKAYNRAGRKQKMTSIFKDNLGRPLEGKVAVAMNTGIKDLEGLVKYQHVAMNRKGKAKVSSVYVVYRIVSELQGGSAWQHPGFKGLKAFEETERMVEKEIEHIIRSLLG